MRSKIKRKQRQLKRIALSHNRKNKTDDEHAVWNHTHRTAGLAAHHRSRVDALFPFPRGSGEICGENASVCISRKGKKIEDEKHNFIEPGHDLGESHQDPFVNSLHHVIRIDVPENRYHPGTSGGRHGVDGDLPYDHFRFFEANTVIHQWE